MLIRLRLVGVLGLLAMIGIATDGQAQDPTLEGRGSLQGRIVDASSGQPLPGAQVVIEGTSWSATTDLNGRYIIRSVPTGVFRVVVRLIGYTPKTVTNVQVDTNEVRDLDVTLARSVVQLRGIEVTAEVERGSAVALIEDRRASTVVTNAIGSEQIARSPDGTAGEALKRVTGMSVVGDRYIVVRGLGDRYSGAQLNGAPLPSPEPDRKAVPLDIFPSGLLESVVTTKTYSPDQPGDYAGGLVDIQTKDFPGRRTVKFSASLGYNSETSLKSGLGYPGGGRDFLGVDDGTRALPSSVPSDVKLIDALVGDQQLQDIGRDFSSVWQPQNEDQPINQSYSLSIADEMQFLGADLGILAAGTYSDSYNTSDVIERILVTSDQDEAPETDYSGETTERTVRWSLFGKTNVLLSPTNQFTVRTLYTRSGEDESRILSGFSRDRNNDLLNYRLRFISRSLWTNTLEGEHLLPGLGDARFHWRAGYSRATSDEPDRREAVYDQISDGRFAWRELTNSGTRHFSELVDDDVNGAADLIIPFNGVGSGQLKVGALFLQKDREFLNRRFRYRAKGPLRDRVFLPPDELFSSTNITPNLLELEEDTRRTDNYTADQRTRAAYAMLDVPVGPLRFSGGARLESVKQTVNPFDPFPLGLPPVDSALIDNTDLLPGVNVTWTPRGDMNVRAAFSRTVSRPEFREQAPFDFVDFAGGFLLVGNPTLQRAAIYSYDVRWEWFPRTGGLFAVSGFYKSFDDPVESVVFPSSELIATWTNNEEATVVGAEFEFRTNLGALARGLENVSVGGNLTLVHSSVTSGDSLVVPGGGTVTIQPRERSLQGQSPYVINASMTYFHPNRGTTFSILYNRFGERLDKVGTQVLPDVFEQPRDQLDLVLQQPLGAMAGVRVEATNLLDSNSEFTQADRVVRSSIRGRSLSVGFSIGAGGS